MYKCWRLTLSSVAKAEESLVIACMCKCWDRTRSPGNSGHLRACPDGEAIKSYQGRFPRGSAYCEEACGLSRSKSGGQRGTASKDRFPLGKWEAAPTKGMPDNVVGSMKDLMLSLEALK